jgi:hypothetical protein
MTLPIEGKGYRLKEWTVFPDSGKFTSHMHELPFWKKLPSALVLDRIQVTQVNRFHTVVFGTACAESSWLLRGTWTAFERS